MTVVVNRARRAATADSALPRAPKGEPSARAGGGGAEDGCGGRGAVRVQHNVLYGASRASASSVDISFPSGYVIPPPPEGAPPQEGAGARASSAEDPGRDAAAAARRTRPEFGLSPPGGSVPSRAGIQRARCVG